MKEKRIAGIAMHNPSVSIKNTMHNSSVSIKKATAEKAIAGITLIALVITIVVLLILAGVSIATLTGDNGLITRARQAKEETVKAENDEKARLQSLEDYISNISPTTQGYSEEKGVNSPKLAKGMIPVKHNGTNWVVCDSKDTQWYSYDSNKKWANVMLSDGTYQAGKVEVGQIVQENELGSMFVWIPRYAYQINGEKNIGVTFLAGNTNQDKDGTSYSVAGADTDTKTTKVVHPGFTLGERELTGLWVAKFEASGKNKNGEAVGNASRGSGNTPSIDETTTVKVLPSVPSWRYISTGEAEKRSMDITTTNKDTYGIDYATSHLIKNNEWGAVAYLCYSQYGTPPMINGSGSLVTDQYWYNMYTGAGPNSASSEAWYGKQDDNNVNGGEFTEAAHGYNTSNGQLASTTRNVTGVYDMSGGAWERVAGYLDNTNGNLNAYGKSADGSIKYFENGVLKPEYASLWNAYEVSQEERENKIAIEGEETLTQGQLWDWDNKRDLKYQEARRRITEVTYQNMAKHKGIGVNEVSTDFSFYAPYTPGTPNNSKPWGWFKTAAEAAAGTQKYAIAWDNDYMLIGHASTPFVRRGGCCNDGSTAGVLYSGVTNGNPGYTYGFRPVVVL